VAAAFTGLQCPQVICKLGSVDDATVQLDKGARHVANMNDNLAAAQSQNELATFGKMENVFAFPFFCSLRMMRMSMTKTPPMTTDRRTFLSRATLATAALGGVPLLGQKTDRKYRTVLVGSGWWGMNILTEAMSSGGVKVVGLCDVDSRVLENAISDVTSANGDVPKGYRDYREMIDKEKPEVVIIATPDHWHALQSIAAVKAGAHVFVEKPTGHTIRESQAMVKAARTSGKIVQVGLHRRIGPHHVSAMRFLKDGNIGDVGMVRCFAHSKGDKEQPKPNGEPPEELDWDMYCGPAPLRPFNSKIHPGGWRNFLDFANGTMGDWGVHWLDQVLWWSGEKGPKSVYCTGGRDIAGPAVLTDREQTTDSPDHQLAVFEFENFTATWEHRKFAENNNEKHRVGAYFYGTKGVLHIGWKDGWTFYPANAKEPVKHEDSQLQEPEGDGHNIGALWANFMDAINGKAEPAADIVEAHRSSCLPLLGMVSWRAGRSIRWDAEKEEIIGDAEASELLSRKYRGPWEYPA
jgi:predicted dehydrogenase